MEDRSTSSTSSTTSVSVTSSGDDLHLVFSTDCSPFQTWQSYLLFHRAMTIKQTGKITRIVSGCDAKKGERELLETWHETFIDPMSPSPGRFSVHFTPKFDGTSEDGKSGKTYSFFNKPFGLLHWLENGIGLDSEGALNDEDIIVVLLDPDQLIMDPIVNDFSGKSVQIPSRVEKAWGGRAKIPTKVVHGTPISQHYGLGAQWTEFDLTTITGTGDSPAAKVSNSDASNFYPVGPPYLMTGRDALSIARKWSEFVRPTNKEYPHLLGEMYAFCIASAHLGLRHVLVDSLMVSNVDAWNAEGWGMIEDIGRSDICDVDKYGDKALPNVLHFCQVYRVGEFAFHKRQLPKDIFSCSHPLLETPPMDLGLANYKTQGQKNGKPRDNVEISAKASLGSAFMLCNLISAINEASRYFKEHHCQGEEVNLEETWNHYKIHDQGKK